MAQKLEVELKKLKDEIVLVETASEKYQQVNFEVLSILTKNSLAVIVISASRPYANFLDCCKKKKIPDQKLFVLDCISKSHGLVKEEERVMYLENASMLTGISLGLTGAIQKIDGKKSVFIDSISSLLIHNQPATFARFVHGLLTKMRISQVPVVLIALEDTPKEILAEIVQLCDKVIKV